LAPGPVMSIVVARKLYGFGYRVPTTSSSGFNYGCVEIQTELCVCAGPGGGVFVKFDFF